MEVKLKNKAESLTLLHNPCFNPSQTATINCLNYFDLYTAHNISHLFTKAVVSDNYSFQQ